MTARIEELVEPVLDAEDPGDDRVVGPHDDVDGGADEQLGHDVGELVDHAGGDGGDEGAAVAAGVPPQADERGGAGVRGDVMREAMAAAILRTRPRTTM